MTANFANGWTLSLVPDLFFPFYSVAAWATADSEVRGADRRWFIFESGGVETRICTLEDFCEVADFVAASDGPDNINAVTHEGKMP